MHMNRTQGALLLTGFMTYLVMGALVFEILENEHHKDAEDAIYHLKEDFLMNYSNLNPAEVELFIQKLVRSVKLGIIPAEQHPHDERSSWDFANSFFFVGTMLATIGYGNLCPITASGQIFCVIFALFGIPFCLICLNHIGYLVSGVFERCARELFGWKNKKFIGRRIKKSSQYIFFFLSVGVVIFLILPSLLFQYVEDWTYSEAIYYTFITLSTIGFGDYLIGRKQDRSYFVGYRLLAAIWIVIGLAWIAVLFALITSKFIGPAYSGKSHHRRKPRHKKKKRPK